MKKNILLLGDGGVGKSCLVDLILDENRIWEPRYLENFHIRIVENEKYKLFDFPGQELYFKHDKIEDKIDLCIIVYDLTNKLSFKAIEQWKIKANKLQTNEIKKIIIVGNKKDCPLHDRKIRNKTLEVSSKRKYNIDQLLHKIDFN
jgi:small GTP-binding protein